MSTGQKVILVGDGGVGKTAWVNKLRLNEFTSPKSTMGVRVHIIKFKTNHGPVVLNMWDCAGLDKFAGLREGYYIQAKAAVVMAALNDVSSLQNVSKWIDSVKKECGDIPIVVAINKADQGTTDDLKHLGNKVSCDRMVLISVKEDVQVHAPINGLIKELKNPSWQLE